MIFMEIPVNINDYVKYSLTSFGESILEKYLADQRRKYGCDASSVYQKHDDGNRHTALWQFMMVFGKHLENGSNTIIYGNELIFE
jgi:hypothetical protein